MNVSSRSQRSAGAFYDVELETLSLASAKALQLEKLKSVVSYTYQNNPAYRRMYESFGATPEMLTALPALRDFPIVRKRELIRSYPWGMLSQGTSDRIAKVFMSGGTSGRPIVVAYTHGEYRWMTECAARLFPAAGATLTESAVVGHFLPQGSHVAQALYDGAALAGCRVVPAHFRYDEEERHLQMIRDFGVRALTIAPTGSKGANLQALLEADRDEVLLEQVVVFLTAGAPLPRDMAADLRREGKVVLSAYGSTELGSIGYRSNQCDLPDDMFHVHADNTLIEIVDAEGAPVDDGQVGFVVATALGGPGSPERAMPMIRYLVGDEAALVEGPRCRCGRTPLYLKDPRRVLDLPRMEKSCAAEW